MPLEDLLHKIDALTDFQFDSSDYSQVTISDVKTMTEKAALIQLDNITDHIWTPFSVMRCDEEKNIYIATWFYKKNF